MPLPLDVTDADDVRAAAAAAGDVRLLINNAGIVAKFGGELTDVEWIAAGRDEYEVNVLGVLAVTQAFAPILARQGGGAIVNLSSVAGLVGFPSLATYSLSKAAVHSLTQVTRALLAPQGTFVAGVYPGPIDTDMARPIPLEKAAARRRGERHPRWDRSRAGRDLPRPVRAAARRAVPAQPEGPRATGRSSRRSAAA